jgi:ankyrin repeat protein
LVNKVWSELLHAAVLHPSRAKQLIDRDPGCLEARTEEVGETVLHWLSIENKVEAVRMLLANGARPDSLDYGRCTPLMNAAMLGHCEVVQALLEFGADVRARNREKETALHRAAATMQVDTARMLLEAGADVNARDALDTTPLLVAMKMAGTEGDSVDYLRVLPPELMVDQEGRAELMATLQQKQPPMWDAEQEIAMVQLLLSFGANPNLPGAFQAPAHCAAEKAHTNPALLLLLLEHGCDVTARDVSGRPVASYLEESTRAAFRFAFASRGVKL